MLIGWCWHISMDFWVHGLFVNTAHAPQKLDLGSPMHNDCSTNPFQKFTLGLLNHTRHNALFPSSANTKRVMHHQPSRKSRNKAVPPDAIPNLIKGFNLKFLNRYALICGEEAYKKVRSMMYLAEI